MGDGHSLDSLGVSLNLSNFVERMLNEVDSSRLVLFSNTRKHSSAALRSNQLRVHDALIVTDILLASVTEVAHVA